MRRSRFVVCIDNAGYPASLELRKIYVALPDAKAEKRNHIRVIDESGEDYLYPATSFVGIELPKNVAEAIVKAALFPASTFAPTGRGGPNDGH